MALLETSLRPPRRRGKVRDVYDLGDRLLIVATDRISAFDHILPNGIPDKGRVLQGLSLHWFGRLESWGFRHHLISSKLEDTGLGLSGPVTEQFEGRSMVVRKAEVVPFECVVRGYLTGSGWKEYRERGTVCGEPLPGGLVESSRLDEPIFTPATKAESGHDENVPFEAMADAIGRDRAEQLRRMSLDAYTRARAEAEAKGLILADTKFEFGVVPGEADPIFVDEVLTPDSSRYWPAEGYEPGRSQPSFDKQFVRDWLESSGWDKQGPPPRLPDEIVERTREKYVQAFETIVGAPFPWK